jgi:protein phosphatase
MKINRPYALNEIGKRQNQEDNIFPPKGRAGDDTSFFLVCDGMGGHENGEVASQTVCESFGAFLKAIKPDEFNESVFERALAFAYDELDQKDESFDYGNTMGTTLTFLYLNDREAFMAHIGDSRIYHLRIEEGNAVILYKSFDHSLVNELLRAEVITPEEAENHPKKNVITRAIQPHLEKRPKAEIHRTNDVKAGDCFFLCSDGVLESLSEEDLLSIIGEKTDDEARLRAILQLCETNSNDNYSAYLVSVAEGIEAAEEVPVLPVEQTPVEEQTSVVIPPSNIKEEEIPVEEEVVAEEDIEVTAPPVVPEKKKKSKLPLLLLIILVALALGAAAYFFVWKPDSGSKKDSDFQEVLEGSRKLHQDVEEVKGGTDTNGKDGAPATNKQQQPASKPSKDTSKGSEGNVPPPPPLSTQEELQRVDDSLWESCKRFNTVEAYKNYLNKTSTNKYSEEAEKKIEKLGAKQEPSASSASSKSNLQINEKVSGEEQQEQKTETPTKEQNPGQLTTM